MPVEAADRDPPLDQTMLKAPPSAAIPYDWTGFYFGGHFSYDWGHASHSLRDPEPTAAGDAFSMLFGGLQIGYNRVLPSRLLVGIEGDISFPYFLEDGLISTVGTVQGTTVKDEIDYIASLRGRVGYAFNDWLIYGTGGFAWSQARLLEMPGVISDQDKLLPTRSGWTAGVGTEVAFAPDWTARLEYLYDRFGTVAGTFPSGTRYESAFDVHMLRLALNYNLHWPGADSVANEAARAWSIPPDSRNIHGQTTLIEQGYPAFRSPYEGQNSLSGASQAKDTVSATAFIGFRPAPNTEIYFNPELMQGFGLSDTMGVAGFPNTEAQKASFPLPRVDVARFYLQQTFGLGGGQQTIEDGPNQLAGTKDISRITVTFGRFAVTDFFDNNIYSHDGRTSFMNWNLYCCGSYDWTMDKISYTWGALTELNQKDWAFRAGYFLVPVVSNVDNYDTHIPERGEYAAELELRYSLLTQPGKLRLFAWVNRANMGSYSEALAMPVTTPGYPDITLTREIRTNYGVVANIEQALNDDLGVFSRVSWSPGLVEIIGWTDCDESLSFGAVLKGTAWGRPDDRIGIAGVVEGLSPEARAYFAAGGLGILIGDGQLSYREEKILEAYYAYSLNKWATFTLDYQLVGDPAYNADRGPVSIFSARLHAEF
jgi:high affinity Mn2+ porin